MDKCARSFKGLVIDLNMERVMFKLTWPEIKEYLKTNDIVLFPTGSTEQSGKHIAEDNDAFIAFALPVQSVQVNYLLAEHIYTRAKTGSTILRK